VFTTAADYQTAVTIHVVQGERPMASDCVSLGMFNLSGIPPAPRGIPQIEVTFDIDANGILNVTAKDLATSKEAKITITANTKLSKEEIEKLKKESEKFADADKKKKEEAEVKNEADNLVYAAEKLVKQDLKEKIKPEQADKVNKSSQELKDAIASNNIDNIKAKMQELKNILGEVSAEAYKTAAAPSTSTSTSGGGAATDSAGVGPTPEEFAKGTTTSDTTPPP
jgi:molecular chaperone DnaK